MHRESGFCSREECHTPHMCQLERGFGIYRVKNLLHRDRVRCASFYNGAQFTRDEVKSLLQWVTRFGANHARVYKLMRAPIGVDDAETGALGSAVYSDNSH